MSDIPILVLDDEPDLRTLYELTLLREGYLVQTAATVSEARALLQAQPFALLITDMRLPDGSGIDLLQTLRKQQRRERCIVITAYGSAENAVESLKAGAFDYLTKPVDLRQFRAVVAAALQDAGELRAAPGRDAPTRPLPPALASKAGEQALARMAGNSAAIRAVRERIVKVACSMAPVMVRGESGTGKELAAYALHANSHRQTGPWVAVNCGAIPESLLEAEFFGARKGAYTGATQDRDGFFQAAHGGTLFLDEIGDLPMAMQVKLLRAIQERRIRPLGANQEEAVDVRIISATHRDLPTEVGKGTFRQDLFYRLNVIDITIPPLRERLEDLPDLCQALLQRIAEESRLPVRRLSGQSIEWLGTLPLAGNVRELENMLHRALALSDSDASELEIGQVGPVAQALSQALPVSTVSPSATEATPLPNDLQAYLDDKERNILVRALRETGFNRTLAARQLGLTLRQIRYRIARLKIDAPDAHGEPNDD